MVHSFWVPQLAGKMDVIPNKTNRVWVEPLTSGTFVGQCAEYCGLQHALMLLTVVVHPREEFDRWAAAQQTPARDDLAARPGRELFASLACINCHTDPGDARQWDVRSRPHAPDEPSDDRRGRRAQYAPDTCAPGSTTPPRTSRAR